MRIIILTVFSLFIFFSCSSPLDDPSTNIQFTIPARAHVTLTVENSYNTIIEKLVDDDYLPGVYNVAFDGSNLAEGIYFYTLEAFSQETGFYFKSAKTFLLIK